MPVDPAWAATLSRMMGQQAAQPVWNAPGGGAQRAGRGAMLRQFYEQLNAQNAGLGDPHPGGRPAGQKYIREDGNDSGMGDIPGSTPPPPPVGATGRPPPTGAAPPPGMGAPSSPPYTGAPPPITREPNQPPPPAPPPGGDPRNPITTPPGPLNPGPYQGIPGQSSLPAYKAFDPTQLLMALRQSSGYGQYPGTNGVQQQLSSWLASAMVPAGNGG